MPPNLYLLAEFLTAAKISRETLKQWESLKLIRPAGLTDEELPYYTDKSLGKAAHIQKLLNIGYGIEDIQRILLKVGVPEATAPAPVTQPECVTEHLSIGILSKRTGLSPRTLKHWEEKGIIEPDMRSSGGFRLYAESNVVICKLIKDLQLFGYSLEEIRTISDYFRDFLALSADINIYSRTQTASKLGDMLKAIERLNIKMNLLEEGIHRWNSFLKRKKNEIQELVERNQKRPSTSRKP